MLTAQPPHNRQNRTKTIYNRSELTDFVSEILIEITISYFTVESLFLVFPNMTRLVVC